MPNYDFLNLSPVDFEELTRDLLQKHLGFTLESFKEGKDQGIDLRYSRNRKNNIIIQCKRFSNISALKKNLINEISKIKILRPSRYIISTSANLSPRNKADIQKIFKGFPLETGDIFGKKDLNNLLGKYPKIEEQHYKLWLKSTSIMKKILNYGIYNRSEFEEEIIKRELKIYVINESYKEAIEILNESNFVIISGIPGIGKTTLARMLVFNLILKDYELVSVSADIQEADDIYDKDINQVFYYNDFLGTNFLLELITKNEDSRIINFIDRVKKSKNKKLIFTTREYILNQAVQQFEVLQNESLQLSKCTIDLKKYTKLIKAKILYNHIYYSSLNSQYIKDLLVDNRFLKIINHPNYNPRIIHYLTDNNFIKESAPQNYYNFFIENLVNPHTIWDYAFRTHISIISRYLLVVLLSLGTPVFKEDLYIALSSYFERNFKYYGNYLNKSEFNKCLRECENTFVSFQRSKEKNIIDFQNPSIRDFLVYYLKSNDEIVEHIIHSAVFFNQFFEIFTIPDNKDKVFIAEELRLEIFNRLKKDIYSLPWSTLQFDFDKNFNRYWSHQKVGKIERLESFVEFFSKEENIELKDFIVNEFSLIDINLLIKENYPIKNFVSIIEYISTFKELEIRKNLEQLFSRELLFTFKNLKNVERIQEYYPDEYETFMKERNIEIRRIVEEVADSEFDGIGNDINDIENYIDDLEGISRLFGYNLNYYRDKAIDKLGELKEDEEEDKNTGKLSSIKNLYPQLDNDEKSIIDIFNSLKFN